MINRFLSVRSLHLAWGDRPKHPAAAPHGFDVVIAARRLGKLFSQLTDEEIDDLGLRLVHCAVEMIQKHLLREDGILA